MKEVAPVSWQENSMEQSTDTRFVPSPNLVPTLELKQTKRREFMDQASLKFTPTSDAAKALLFTEGELRNDITPETLAVTTAAATITKRLPRRRKGNRKKLAKKEIAKAKTSPVPTIASAMFAMTMRTTLPIPRHFSPKKKRVKPTSPYDKHAATGIYISVPSSTKQKLPVLSFSPKGKLGTRLFKSTVDAEIARIDSPIAKQVARNSPTIALKKSSAHQGFSKNRLSEETKVLKVEQNHHSQKKHQLMCQGCLQEFSNASHLKIHSEYKCPWRLEKCTNPCCGELIPVKEMAQHRGKECIWLRYNATVLSQSKKHGSGAWPKLEMKSLHESSIAM